MQLPERFLQRPRSQALERYIARRYSTYGYPNKWDAIAYNPEFLSDNVGAIEDWRTGGVYGIPH